MKKIVAIFMMSIMLLLVGCAQAEEMKPEEKVRAVKVQKIEETKNAVSLNYIGTVDSKSIMDYSFKTGGKLEKVYVKKGDQVKKGDILAALDKEDINLQLAAAKANLASTEENIKKAEDTMNYNEDQLNKMEKLYEAGSISKSQYDQIKLQRDTSVATYNQAKSQYEATQVNYENILIALEESSIYAKEDGIVVEIPHEEGERIANPTMSYVTILQVRSIDQIINVGIAQKDLNKIQEGIKAIVDIDGEIANGVITSIDEAPDQATRTYNAEVRVEDKNYRLGSIAKVSFHVGEEKGVWIPMQSIFSNGEDYVYIVKEDRAFKRTITLLKNYENKVMVKGVKPEELLAISGMKNLNDGSKVNIVE
ncbi:efflux RND transporter periplasmic adaptor subunit [Crassaminicella profunda]|uniref:efflux RND transporter periplasmic adaptor subunit n=1 Tax=Crassaminicella profunda TaxID=1286698 RepID=UPI001CA6893B|nr:efflux RND transporter periplasmic adaptor subunit [Crassaminicella profunda]QZY54373.1 efflux RND transporter periplasmic adaptor subunit [Crassaminicella profunda]